MMRSSPNKHTIKMDVKTSIGFLLHADTSQVPEDIRNCQERTIKVPNDAFEKELEILSWRFKTFLPIVKPVNYELIPNPSFPNNSQQLRYQQPQHKKVNQSPKKFPGGKINRESCGSPFEKEDREILVKMEEVRCRLSDLDLLPLPQIIYLLKEMMIGYDALIDIFGIFGPTDNMVGVSSNQWKVWINEDFFKNSKNQLNSATGERDFIYRLLMITEKHCQGTTISKTFFNELKQFTYSNQCGFISMIEKIKDFTKLHKIYQVNKVSLPQDKRAKQKTVNPEISHLNITDNSYQRQKPGSKLRLEKKLSFQPNTSIQYLHYQGTNKNTVKGAQKMGNNVSQIVGKPIMQHAQSQKNLINHSSVFYYPQNSHLSPLSSPVATNNSNKFKTFLDVSESWNNSSQLLKPPQKPIKSSFMQKGLPNDLKPYRSPDIVPHKMSPTKVLNKNSSFANLSKSRHQLKLLVNKDKVETHNPINNLHPDPQQSRKNQRKYSEQLFKPKSVDALAVGMKKICGSNIYEQDPEIRAKGVNVIKKKKPNQSNQSPIKGQSQTFKGPDSTTPNHSSNSTNEMHHSGQNYPKGNNYQYLKQNDLNNNKLRNNQSSCYGMGGYLQQQKKDVKNMTISYEFKNRNENQSKSSASSQNKQHQNGNNWNKKISGLFSDDASIKHLKGSVKFKTAEEERFEKEYLKDVKLDMLEKFGRPVRHSIVDQEDDFRPSPKNPYKSMQLIEEVIDEGKSYMEKEEEMHEEVQTIEVRGRNKTVQVATPQDENIYKEVKQRQCYSFECSEGSDSQGGFNFEPEPYVLNRR